MDGVQESLVQQVTPVSGAPDPDYLGVAGLYCFGPGDQVPRFLRAAQRGQPRRNWLAAPHT